MMFVFDFSDLQNPVEFFEYFGPTPAVDHNGYVKGDIYYLANYRAGMRAIDLSDIENQNMVEIGFFDTVPSNDDANFGGAWSVYPYFDSNNIVISGDAGFTLVRDNSSLGITDTQQIDFTLSPNPATEDVTINSSQQPIQNIEIFNVLGQQVQNVEVNNALVQTISTRGLSAGIYLVKINGNTTKRLMIK